MYVPFVPTYTCKNTGCRREVQNAGQECGRCRRGDS